MKQKASRLYKIIVILVALTIGLLYFFSRIKLKRKFFQSKISSQVISASSYAGRSIELLIGDGNKVYFMPPLDGKIAIGDSISKPANTYVYRVYRKNKDCDYVFIGEYDLLELE